MFIGAGGAGIFEAREIRSRDGIWIGGVGLGEIDNVGAAEAFVQPVYGVEVEEGVGELRG